MQQSPFSISLIVIVLFLLDLYTLNGIRSASGKWLFLQKKWFTTTYLIVSGLLLIGLLLVIYVKVGLSVRLGFLVVCFFIFLCKASFLPFLIIDDIRRLSIYTTKRFKKPTTVNQVAEPSPFAIPRSEFLMKAGLLAGAVPLAALRLNMKSGLYDYQIKRQTLYLPNLPKAFDGLKLGQLSDIHSGSFYNKKAVLGGIEMLLREKPDLIFLPATL